MSVKSATIASYTEPHQFEPLLARLQTHLSFLRGNAAGTVSNVPGSWM
jgi:hypothetical protein